MIEREACQSHCSWTLHSFLRTKYRRCSDSVNINVNITAVNSSHAPIPLATHRIEAPISNGQQKCGDVNDGFRTASRYTSRFTSSITSKINEGSIHSLQGEFECIVRNNRTDEQTNKQKVFSVRGCKGCKGCKRWKGWKGWATPRVTTARPL